MALARRDFLREAEFFFITFFLAALSKADMAFFMASIASDFLPVEIRVLTVLTAALKLSLVLMLRTLRRRACLMALAADLVLGINFFLKRTTLTVFLFKTYLFPSKIPRPRNESVGLGAIIG